MPERVLIPVAPEHGAHSRPQRRLISEFSDRELDNLITNYRKSGKEEGGVYALAEVRLEKARRIKSPFPPRDVAKVIVESAQQSDDGNVTYKEIWLAFRPDDDWMGNMSQTEVGNALGRVIAWCVDNQLPILSTLVVRSDSRKHTAQAEQNIYDEAKNLGVDVGIHPRMFVQGQAEKARKLMVGSLPD